jgi:hypothetical protein
MSRDQNRALVSLSVLALVVIAMLVWRSNAAPAQGPPATDGSSLALSQAPLDAVQRFEFEALQQELRALRTELDLLRQLPRAEAAPGTASHVPAPHDIAPAAFAGTLTPREALALFVRSFENGGEGIEYYRLVVQAHAHELVLDILVHVSSRRSPVLLRLRLVEILGDARLRGNTRVLGVLAVLLEEVEDQRVPQTAAEAIVRLTRESDAPWVEAHWARSPSEPVRITLLDHLVELAGDDPNPCLVRLLATAPDEPARALVIARLSPSSVDTAVPAFELVQGLEQPTRLAGALRVREFRSDGMSALVQAWRNREPDEAVRQALGAALEALAKVPAYHPEQALGAPDVTDLDADDARAWAPATADGGLEWLEVEFAAPMRANLVRVHETCRSGALQELVLVLDDGTRETGWRGTSSRPRPGVFEVPIQPSRPVRAVRLVLDTARVSGWNEIDAVELVGPGGAAYASGARASSFYGQGRRGSFAKGEAQQLDAILQFYGR